MLGHFQTLLRTSFRLTGEACINDIVILDYIARLRAAKGVQPTDDFFLAHVCPAPKMRVGRSGTRIVGIEMAVRLIGFEMRYLSGW